MCLVPFLAATASAKEAPAVSPPNLTEQLEAAGARPGTAYAALIAANQDFTQLRAEEPGDKIPVPLWLRAYWRRLHPEMVYSAGDPTGGYPFVLKEVVEWMRSHQALVPGPGDEAGEELFEDFDKAVSVSGETRVSGLQAAARSESDIRVNYLNPLKIISASNNISAAGQQGQYWSTDGGVTWGQTLLPLQVGDAFHSDPTVDWTSDGTAWSTTIGINGAGSILRMRSYKSVDSGATWTFDATFSGTHTSADKQLMWVDHSATSAFKDNIYVCWHNGNPAFVNRRTGVAGSWQTPLQVSGAESTGTAIGCDVKSNAFGDVFVFWPTTSNRRIIFVKSTNGGVSFSAGAQIATTFDAFDIGVPSFASRRPLIYVSGGTYRTAAKNMVYAAWTDLTGAAGCTGAGNEPGTNVASTCKTRIWFSRSTDGGTTWSPKAMINNQASLNDQFSQALAVDETTGALSVIYQDTVGDAGRKKSDVWYQSSFDDGATWSAAVKVTTVQTDETSAGADSGNQYGDYNSLTGIAGNFFPSWTDRRGGAREEIWTAKITDLSCTAPGVPAIGTASATAPNTIQVTWANGTPPSTSFHVYRAPGTCASPGSFGIVGNGVAGSPFNDGTVSVGNTYAYKVSGRDVTGSCESAVSACVQATATGSCTTPPTFAGLVSATNQGATSCGIVLGWAAAASNCSAAVTYNVYRSATSGFTPGAGNLIAAGVVGTGYTDAGTLVDGTTYYYVVRAVDSSNAVADGNSVEKSAKPSGPSTLGSIVETFEGALSGGGFDNAGWTHPTLSGTLAWSWNATQAQTPTHAWASDEEGDVADRVLVSPTFAPQAASTLSFWHTFSFEGSIAECFDAGTLEVSTDGGTTWSVMPDANFTTGPFNSTVVADSGNPIGGSRAWCAGTVGAMTQVTVNLASFMPATEVKLRWHEGDDESATAGEPNGWFVDSVTLASVGIPGACVTGPSSAIFSNGFESGNLLPWIGGFAP